MACMRKSSLSSWLAWAVRNSFCFCGGTSFSSSVLLIIFKMCIRDRQFPVTAPLHFPEVVDCLMVEYQLAVSIELAPLAIVIAGDHIHLFTPFPGGMRWVSPFPLTRRTQSRSLPAKSLLFENFLKNFFEAGLSSENSKKRPASRNGPAGRRNVL